MQQYFVKQSLRIGEAVALDAAQSHHILHVMRMKPGAIVRLADDHAVVMEATLRMRSGQVWALPCRELNVVDSPFDVTLIMGLIKGERWEWVIQKAAELGASRIVPLQSRYCVVKLADEKLAKKLQRWRMIAQEASEQCKRPTILQVEAPITMNQLATVKSERNLIAYELADAHSMGLKAALRDGSYASISVMVGCEGGFSEEEVAQAQKEGYRCVSLGTRILRAETAAIALLANIGYELETGREI